jgi:hypothetical protein
VFAESVDSELPKCRGASDFDGLQIAWMLQESFTVLKRGSVLPNIEIELFV